MIDLLVAHAEDRKTGRTLPAEHPFEWLNAFEGDDLDQFIEEARLAFHRGDGRRTSGSDLGSVIHEWQESAWASRSVELAEAFAAEADRVPLTPPHQNGLQFGLTSAD